MKKFWAQAAQLLRPGGTVAIWVRGKNSAHPNMPYAAKATEIQRAFDLVLEPYLQPGNRIAHDMYENLELPWTADPTQTSFPKDKFRRFDWDRHGVLSDGRDFFGGSREMSLEVLGQVLSTGNPVTRWREAHPELAGTERDCVNEMLGQLREVLGESKMRGGQATALLMLQKST